MACLLSDGGLGICSTARCLSPNDPSNCGFPGLVCPAGYLCAQGNCDYPLGGGGNFRVQCNPGPPASDCDASLACLLEIGCARSTCAPDDDDLACDADGGVGFCCQGACHATASDPNNCGGCGIICGEGTACSDSSCRIAEPCNGVAGTIYPPICRLADGSAGSCCAGGCVESSNDPNNCGGCGATCPTGASCNGGACSFSCESGCPQGYSCGAGSCWRTDCTGAADGVRCQIEPTSPYGGTCCGQICVNPVSDPNNCAACGFSCGENELCVNFSCVSYLDCAAGALSGAPCLLDDGDAGACCMGRCGRVGECGFESCVTSLDPQNCGSCGNVCASGICAQETSPFNFSPTCLPTGPGNDCAQTCAAGELCLDGQCLSGVCGQFPVDSFCAAENGTIGVCCPVSGACAHPLDDPENCGTCGNACGGGACVDGSCTNMPGCGNGRLHTACNLDAGAGYSGYSCCPSVGCIDTSSDPQNCGQDCAQCSRVQNCVDGQCK